MGIIPTLGVGSSVAVITESPQGTREAIIGGASSVEFLDVLSETLDYVPVLAQDYNLIGARQAQGDLQYISHNDGGGSVIFRPRYAQMASLLTWAFSTIDTTYKPSAKDVDLTTFSLECIKAGQNDICLIGCKVNTLTFRSNPNMPLECEMSVFAASGIRGCTPTAADLTTLAATDPFVHARLVMTSTDEAWLGGATPQPIRSIEVTINNNLDGSVFANAIDRATIPVGLFEMVGTIEIPYNSVTSAFWTEQAAASKVKFSVEWEDGASGNNFKLDFVAKVIGDLPKISDPGIQWLTVNFAGAVDAADANCVFGTLTAAI